MRAIHVNFAIAFARECLDAQRARVALAAVNGAHVNSAISGRRKSDIAFEAGMPATMVLDAHMMIEIIDMTKCGITLGARVLLADAAVFGAHMLIATSGPRESSIALGARVALVIGLCFGARRLVLGHWFGVRREAAASGSIAVGRVARRRRVGNGEGDRNEVDRVGQEAKERVHRVVG